MIAAVDHGFQHRRHGRKRTAGKGKSMANIRQVAERAGVSPATVSRVLNNNQTYKITNETRENVLRAVTELGYQPLIKKTGRSGSVPKAPRDTPVKR